MEREPLQILSFRPEFSLQCDNRNEQRISAPGLRELSSFSPRPTRLIEQCGIANRKPESMIQGIACVVDLSHADVRLRCTGWNRR